jgi:hypothetical protein
MTRKSSTRAPVNSSNPARPAISDHPLPRRVFSGLGALETTLATPRLHKIVLVGFAALALLSSIAPASAQQACPDPYSARGACTPITASATGTTGAIAATLPAVSGKTAYICGFFYTGTNTSAPTSVTLTITGTISGTMNFVFSTLTVAAATPNPIPLDEEFIPRARHRRDARDRHRMGILPMIRRDLR